MNPDMNIKFCFLMLICCVYFSAAIGQTVISARSDAKSITFSNSDLAYKGFTLCDTGIGTSTIKPDNILQPGEIVQLKFFIENNGNSVASDVSYFVTCSYNAVSILKNFGNMGNLVPGQIKSFSLYINPNKNFHGSYIPLYLTVKIKNQEGGIKKMSIRLPLNKKTETTTISEYDPNHPNNITDVNGTQVKGIGNATISKTLRPDAIGIVIGIEDYQDLPKATYALNDADIVSTYFKNTLGVSNVLTYKNERANWIFFDNMFNLETGELKKMIKPGVTDIFVYFFGTWDSLPFWRTNIHDAFRSAKKTG